MCFWVCNVDGYVRNVYTVGGTGDRSPRGRLGQPLKRERNTKIHTYTTHRESERARHRARAMHTHNNNTLIHTHTYIHIHYYYHRE